MSLSPEIKRPADEHKLGIALVRKKLLTDGQLRAATDYQRSLGGRLADALIKLGLLRPAQLDEALRQMEGGESPGDARGADGAIDPAQVRVSDLKVHRKLLEKIPQDFQERFLLVPFFPLPHGDSRKIVMGHGREFPAELAAKVGAILGIDICTLVLEESVARDLASGEHRAEARRAPPAGSVRLEPRPEERDEPREESAHNPSDQVLNSLLTLLIRKGYITRDEIETEIALGFTGRRKP